MRLQTGLTGVDMIIISTVALQGVTLGLNPNTTQALNTLGLLVIAVIGVWTAHKTATIKKVADATHILSNSAMGAQLKMNVVFARSNAIKSHRIAELTKEEGDVAAAAADDVTVREQEAIYQAHLVQQARVDAKEI